MSLKVENACNPSFQKRFARASAIDQMLDHYSRDHLPSQFDLRGKLPIVWDADPTPLFRQSR
jgi:hypothetical protein